MKTFQKAPADVLDFDVWFDQFLEPGDRLTTVAATVPAAATLMVDSTTHDERKAKIWLSGGSVGETTTITVVVQTLNGRTKQECFAIEIRECD